MPTGKSPTALPLRCLPGRDTTTPARTLPKSGPPLPVVPVGPVRGKTASEVGPGDSACEALHVEPPSVDETYPTCGEHVGARLFTYWHAASGR